MASVKAQIISAIREKMNALRKDQGGPFRTIKQTRSITLTEDTRDALHWVKGQEHQIDQDNQGRTYQFPLAIKILPLRIEDEEELVAAVEATMEDDIQLGGLCVTIDDREEHPFFDAVKNEAGGVLLSYNVQFRHKRGNPSANYLPFSSDFVAGVLWLLWVFGRVD